MLIIYRIQHKDLDQGPYRGYRTPALQKMGLVHSDGFDHPTLWYDCKYPHIYDSTDYFCGFSQYSMLLQWFEGWFSILHENDYILVVYAVDEAYSIEGSKQTAFIKERATLISTASLENV